MTNNSKRVALWGGSFNPPTLAHKSLSEFAFSKLGLDVLYWIVSPHNPEKDATTLAPFPDRYAMVQQLLAGQSNTEASDIEHKLGSSLTINTVKAFRQQMPDDYLFFLMGTDNWLGFHRWSGNFKEIMDNVSIVILNRPGPNDAETAESTAIFADKRVYSPEDLKKSNSWYVLDNPVFDVSATQARMALANGEIPDVLAPETLEYIRKQGLYSQ